MVDNCQFLPFTWDFLNGEMAVRNPMIPGHVTVISKESKADAFGISRENYQKCDNDAKASIVNKRLRMKLLQMHGLFTEKCCYMYSNIITRFNCNNTTDKNFWTVCILVNEIIFLLSPVYLKKQQRILVDCTANFLQTI